MSPSIGIFCLKIYLIVWDYWTLEAKLKNGSIVKTEARGMYTWIKSDGKWRMIAGHASPIPAWPDGKRRARINIW